MDLEKELTKKLTESAVEIFTGMVMMELEPASKPVRELRELKQSITGMVGLAGMYKGLLAIHVPNEIAKTITGNFLGLEVDQVDEVNEDVQDAIGELANMLGGSLKNILSDKGKDIQLSLPSTISGESYTFMPQSEIDKLILAFNVAQGIFYVQVELES
ncbi:MAG: chemotaxis protein CheX [Desulfobulbus propionicus]|nr:MAG: chemotaxis protein CheX [Desulfobulbus propionicus]